MADNETRVIYKAIANFSDLSKKIRDTKRELAALRAEEALLNTRSAAGARSTSTAASGRAKSNKNATDAAKAYNTVLAASVAQTLALAKSTRVSNLATNAQTAALKRATTAALAHAAALRVLDAAEAKSNFSYEDVPNVPKPRRRKKTAASAPAAAPEVDNGSVAKQAMVVYEARNAMERYTDSIEENTRAVRDNNGAMSQAIAHYVGLLALQRMSGEEYRERNQSMSDGIQLEIEDGKQGSRAAMERFNGVRKLKEEYDGIYTVINRNNKAGSNFKMNRSQLELESSMPGTKNKRGWADLLNFLKRFKREGDSTRNVFGNLLMGSEKLNKSFIKLGNWRPNWRPPFIALIPLVGSVIGAITPLLAVLGAAGGAVIGFASSLGTLAGVALALPGILAAVASGVGGVVAAFQNVGGVFSALSAMRKAQSKSTNTAVDTGPSAADRAREITRATQDIADAQEDLGRTYEDTAERISDAERDYAKSLKATKRAQDDLNDSREEALQDLMDLRQEVSRSAMTEERAYANLIQAREEYNNVMADPGSTQGDKLDAAVSVKEAEADLADVRAQNTKNAQDLAVAEQKGVDGADKVVNAQEGVTDALEAQDDAYRELQRARKDESRSIRDAERRLEDAQRALYDAQNPKETTNATADAAATAADEYQKALDKLSPSAKAVVLALIGMEDAWNKVTKAAQEAFFSKIVDDMDDLASLIPVIGSLLEKAAGAMGTFAHNFIQMVSSDPWKADIFEQGERNVGLIDSMGRGALALADGLRNVMMAAGPFTQWLVDSLAEGAENFRDLTESGRETGALAGWLDKVRRRLEQWWRIIKNVGATIFNYSSAASSFADWLTNGLERTTEAWKTASEEATKEDSPFKKWLEDIKPLLAEMKALVDGFFSWFGKEVSDNGTIDPETGEVVDVGNIQRAIDMLEIIRTDLGPAIARLFDTLSESGIAEDLLDTVTSIVETIDLILENGGADALKSFYDIVKQLFDAIKEIVAIPGVGGVLVSIGSALGVIAGLTFVGKFTGLFALFGWLVTLTKTKGLLTLLAALGKLPGLKLLGGLAAAGLASGAAGAMAGAGGVAGAAASGTRGAAAAAAGAAAASGSGAATGAAGAGAAEAAAARAAAAAAAAGKVGLGSGLRLPALGAGAAAAGGAGAVAGGLKALPKGLLGRFFMNLFASSPNMGSEGTVKNGKVQFNKKDTAEGGIFGKNIFTKWLEEIFGPGDKKPTKTTTGSGGGGGGGGGFGMSRGAPIDLGNSSNASKGGQTLWDKVTGVFGELTGQTEKRKPGAKQSNNGVWDTITGVFSGLTGQTEGKKAKTSEANGKVWDATSGNFSSLKSQTDGRKTGVATSNTTVWDTVTGLFGSLTGTTNTKKPGVQTSNTTVWDTVSGVFNTLTGNTNGKKPGVTTSNTIVWDTVSGLFNTLTGNTNGKKPGTVSSGNSVWDTVQGVFNTLTGNTTNTHKPETNHKLWELWDANKNAFSGLKDNLPGFLKPAATALSDFWGKLTENLANLFNAGSENQPPGKGRGDAARAAKGAAAGGSGPSGRPIRGGTSGAGGSGAPKPNMQGGVGDYGPDTAVARAKALMPKGTVITDTWRSPEYNRAVGGTATSYHLNRENPAVDVAGPNNLLWEFYNRIKAVGGWRQILWQVAGHYDHVHVANKGGYIGAGRGGVQSAKKVSGPMRPMGKDTEPAMLTPGEFVLRKGIVDAIGAQNLSRLNSGVLSYTDLLTQFAAQNQDKSKPLSSGNGIGDILSGVGLSGGLPSGMPRFANMGSRVPSMANSTSNSTTLNRDSNITIQELNVHNPKPEPASSSVASQLRKTGYLGRRGSGDR